MDNQVLPPSHVQIHGSTDSQFRAPEIRPSEAVLVKSPLAAVAGHRPFLSHINHFRAVAILLIVALHCYSILQLGAEPYFLRRATLQFMFISGFLFQYLSARFNRTVYWQKKLRYILFPYVVVSTPIILFRIAAASYSSDILSLFPGFATQPAALQALEYYASGLHLVPFWFIPMICCYYLLAPVFIKLDRQGLVYYFLPVFLLLSLLVTRAPEVYKIHLAFVHYLSVYLLGMFVSRHNRRVLEITDKLWPLLAVLVVVALTSSDLVVGVHKRYVEQFLFIQKLVFCWGLMYGFWKFDGYIPKQLSAISERSFGIFFLHYYPLFALDVADYKGYFHLPPTFASFCLIFLVDLAFCLVMLQLIKGLFGARSRLLVGY